MNDAPKTLLQMSQAPEHPSPLDCSALLLIDHQKEYTIGQLKLNGIDSAVEEIAQLLKLARMKHVPVIHVRHLGNSLFDENGITGQFIDKVCPLPNEIIIGKKLPNAFANTDLDSVLKSIGRKEIIVAGFMTHMCVSATVRSALDHGYRSTIVSKATATRDLPGPNGQIIAASDIQIASLAALADHFAVLVSDATAWL